MRESRVQRWLEFLTAFDYTLEYHKGSPTEMPISYPVCQSLPRNTTVVGLTPVDDGGIFSSGPAGFVVVPLRPPALAWMGWCPAPRTLFWVGSRSPLRFSRFSRARATCED